jgi:hypothetical protein
MAAKVSFRGVQSDSELVFCAPRSEQIGLKWSCYDGGVVGKSTARNRRMPAQNTLHLPALEGFGWVRAVPVEQFRPIPHDRPFGPLGKFGSILAANSANCAVFAGYAGL